VHYRSGEVVRFTSRFLHSRQYAAVLRDVCAAHPSLPVVVFTSQPPEAETDDLSTFHAHGARILTQAECPAVPTFAAFAHARVLVMGRSSFSYTPALLRDPATTTTVYQPMSHGRAHATWHTWDVTGLHAPSEGGQYPQNPHTPLTAHSTTRFRYSFCWPGHLFLVCAGDFSFWQISFHTLRFLRV